MPQAKLISPITKQGLQKKRVAAYCRVSTNLDDQKTSYATQIRVYQKMINDNPEDFRELLVQKALRLWCAEPIHQARSHFACEAQ